MNIDEFWNWIQDSELAFQIGATWWFPLLESIHILAVALLFGSILVVDLRLIGVTALNYPVSRLHRELTGWTWGAFALATVTGLGMFISRPGPYADNTAFQIKLLLLLLSGLNLLVFHKFAYATVADWDTSPAIPRSARLAGLCSLTLWAGVIVAGRWVGHLL